MDDEPTVSPMARRAARERGIDLATLRGSGPGGKIVLSDVEDALAAPPVATVPEATEPEPERLAVEPAPPAPEPEPAEPATAPVTAVEPEPAEPELPVVPTVRTETVKGAVEVVEPTRLQGQVARRVAESRATVPDATFTVEVDAEALLALQEQLAAAAAGREGSDPVPTVCDLVVKACALALRAHPKANGAYKDARYELHARVNVGVVVPTASGPLVPVVVDADAKDLPAIARETAELARRAVAGETTNPELAGATFTVADLGPHGVRRFAPVVQPPQAAALGVGEVAPRAVVRDGAVVARHTVELTLATDHRILQGPDAAAFLVDVRAALEAPLKLVL